MEEEHNLLGHGTAVVEAAKKVALGTSLRTFLAPEGEEESEEQRKAAGETESNPVHKKTGVVGRSFRGVH